MKGKTQPVDPDCDQSPSRPEPVRPVCAGGKDSVQISYYADLLEVAQSKQTWARGWVVGGVRVLRCRLTASAAMAPAVCVVGDSAHTNQRFTRPDANDAWQTVHGISWHIIRMG